MPIIAGTLETVPNSQAKREEELENQLPNYSTVENHKNSEESSMVLRRFAVTWFLV